MPTVQPDFYINNNLLPSPSEHKWIIPDVKGDNGNGQKQYTPYFSYEISWNRMSQNEFSFLYNIWLGHYNSGTAVVKLPSYFSNSYLFTYYSGVVIDQPVVGGYDENYVVNIKLTIRKINIR